MAAHTADDPGPTDPESPQDGTFEQYPVASFTAKGGQALAFPVISVKEGGGNRLVPRDRPNRPGVKVDSTGPAKKSWTMVCEFSNEASRYEPGLDPNTPLYPDVLNAVIDAFDVQATGDLVIPTRGKRRVWGFTYDREEKNDERDLAMVTFVFIEDNEDDVDASAIEQISVKGSGDLVVTKAIFDGQSLGAWNGSLAGLLEDIRELQGILNLPQTFLDDTRSNATAIIRTVQDLISTFSDDVVDARSMFTDPASSRLTRRLTMFMDVVSGSEHENSGKTQKKTTSVVYTQDFSIFDIATKENQNPQDLMDLNQYRIEDLLHIEAGSVVLIYA
jgi:hypothetical protein